VLVVLMDTGPYSSTSTAPNYVRRRLRPGSTIPSISFTIAATSFRAFAKLLDESSQRFELVAASNDLSNVAFKCVA
jgi:hypothetical protein